jgi:hypothetical protein
MIAKKPKPSAKEATFITGAAASNSGTPRGQFNFQRVTINVDQAMVNKVDAQARSMGLNRSAFILMAIHEKVRQMEREA